MVSTGIMKAMLSLGIPLLLVTAGNYAAFAERVATTISLDVNPSIEITANESNEVLEVKALNEDAKTVMSGMDLESVDLEVAMDIIIGVMVLNGYIDETKNAVLITVDNKNEAKRKELEALITTEINDTLAVDNISPVIFAQHAESGRAKAKAFAKQHDISVNKAAFILKILDENDTLSEKKLVVMNVESLSDVIRSKHIDLHDSVAYSDKTLTKTNEKTKKPVKAADTQTASSGKETEKQAEESPAIETQVKATNKQEGANTQLIGQPAVTTITPPEAQSQAIEQQAAANSNAVEKQAEAEAKAAETQIMVAAKRAAERQAEAEAKEKEEQLKAAEKQAEAEAKEAEKQAEAESKEAEKQAEADAKALEKKEKDNGNSADSDN
jgi:hypothetical protein